MNLLDKLFSVDAKYSNSLRIPDERIGLRNVAAFLAHSGDSWFWGVGLALFYFLGPGSWRSLILLLLLGIFFTAITVLTVKFLVKRPRPQGDWGQIYRSSDPHSFPSGHAARAMMLTVLIFLTGFWWLGLVMLIWTILMDLSRIGLGVHYLSDILAGTLLGILMGGAAFWVFSVL